MLCGQSLNYNRYLWHDSLSRIRIELPIYFNSLPENCLIHIQCSFQPNRCGLERHLLCCPATKHILFLSVRLENTGAALHLDFSRDDHDKKLEALGQIQPELV